jgi:hypothetical protein
MSVLAGTSVLREFLEFMSSSAQTSLDKFAPDAALPDDLKHELDAFLALALAAYDELRALSDEATRAAPPAPGGDDVASGLQEAHGTFVEACRPLLRLLGQARRFGAMPRRADAFMAAFGEADLIANRSQRVAESERQADQGQTRGMEEIRDELRRRVHARGG